MRSRTIPNRATRLAMLREALEDANAELREGLFYFECKAVDRLSPSALIRLDHALVRYFETYLRSK